MRNLIHYVQPESLKPLSKTNNIEIIRIPRLLASYSTRQEEKNDVYYT